MMNTFPLWAMEMDGELDTRFSKIRKIIKSMNNGLDIDTACLNVGITELTQSEFNYIMMNMGE